jgi:2-aminoadipate transaminase
MSELLAFTRGVPADKSFAVEELIVCAEEELRRYGMTILQHHPPRGFLPLREAIADEEGVPVERVILGNGSMYLLDFLIRTATEPGDTVLVERPTYDRTINALPRARLDVHGIPIQEDGPNIDLLEEAIRKLSPRLFYTIPDFQNPTGATMSDAKREAVVELAACHGMLVVADLPYRPLRYWGSEPRTISAFGGDHVIRMSSFSKLISPGMRVGWMIAPDEILNPMVALAEAAYICPSMVSQGMAYEFIWRGALGPTIERLEALYEPRLSACLNALERYLPEASWTRPQGGFFFGLTLPEGSVASDVQRRALDLGVKLGDGEGFYPDGDGSRFVRLPFCALSEEQIDRAIQALGRAVHESLAEAKEEADVAAS